MGNQIAKLTPELAALLAVSDIDALAPFSREIFLLDIVVAGTTYCKDIPMIAEQLTPEVVLKMKRNPQNKYDDNAIAIYFENIQIGWVPQELNLIISRLMDAGKAFFCRIIKTQKKGNWLKIDAKIYMVE